MYTIFVWMLCHLIASLSCMSKLWMALIYKDAFLPQVPMEIINLSTLYVNTMNNNLGITLLSQSLASSFSRSLTLTVYLICLSMLVYGIKQLWKCTCNWNNDIWQKLIALCFIILILYGLTMSYATEWA